MHYFHSFLLEKPDTLNFEVRKELCLFRFPSPPLQNKPPNYIGISFSYFIFMLKPQYSCLFPKQL